MATEREIKFKISADANGAERIQKLADEINALAKSGGDASPEFKRLGAELDAIANQSALITQFAELKNKTLEVKAAITDAADATGKSALAFKERTAELAKATAAEKSSSEVVTKHTAAVNAANVGIREAKAEIADYNAKIAASGKATDEQTKGLKGANTELKQYKSELASAKSELDKVLPAQIQNAEALKQSQLELNKTSAAFERNQAASAALKSEYRQSESALQSVRDKMSAAGVSASELSTEYVKVGTNIQRLADEFAREKQALEASLAAQKAATDALKASDTAYKERVATLKADAQVEAQVISLAQSQNKVLLEAERNTLALAKAKKDEKAIAESMASIRDIEVRQTKLTAEGLRLEASAEELLTNAKRDHLSATSRSTSATDAEIVAERLAIDSKRTLASATDQAALRQKEFAVNSEKSGGALSTLGGFARSALLPLQAVIAAFAGATEFVRVNVELENIGRTFKSITGSSQGAAQEMAFVKDASNRLGLELVGTAKAYAQFAAATKGSSLEGEQTRKIFQSVAHAMSVAGRSAAETEGALNALGQMVSKGVVQMEELRGQLGDRLPGAMKVAADSAGLTTAQLIKMVESGDVLAEDLLPKLALGLDRTFKDSADNVSTTSQEFNRLRNSISEVFAQIGESQVLKGLIVTVAGLGTIITGFVTTVTLGLTGLGATIAYTSTVLVTFFKLITFQDGWTAFKANVADASDRLGTFFTDAIKKAAEEIELFKKLLPSFGDEVGKTATATDVLATSTQKTGAAAALSKTDWLALVGTYAESRKQLEKFAEVAEKHVASVKSEGEALTQLATLQGDESRIKQVAIEVAEANQVALQKEALAKGALLDVLERQLAAEKEVEANAKVQSKEHLKKIEELTQLVAARKEEAEKALAQANASKIVSLQAQIEGKALRDNSGRVKELGDEYQSLLVKVNDLREAKKNGADVSEKLTDTEKNLAQASRLLSDATSDLVKNLEAASTVKRGENDLAQLTVKLHIEEKRTALDLAKSKGDESAVRRINNEIRKLEAELSRLQSALLKAEAEATLAMVQAKKAEITARRELTKVEELEFKAQELGAQAKIKQSQIQDEIVKRMSQSIETTNNLATSNKGLANSYEGMGTSAKTAMAAVEQGAMSAVGSLAGLGDHISTASERYKGLTAEWADWYRTIDEDINGLIDATHRLDEAMGHSPGVVSFQNQIDGLLKSLNDATAASNALIAANNHGTKFDKDGYEVNTQGDRVASSTNPAPVGDASGGWSYTDENGEFRRSNTRPVQDAKGNWYDPSNRGGMADASDKSSGQMSSPADTSSKSTHGLNTYTVNINLGGKSTAVNTASEKDAQALITLLGQLGTDKSRAQ